MARASLPLALSIAALLAACGQAPIQPDNPILTQAQEAHDDGQSAFARRDFDSARRHFEQALRLHQSIDDRDGAALNRLDLARSRLALNDRSGAEAELDAALAATSAPALRAEAARQKAVLALLGNRLDDAQRWQGEAATACGVGCAMNGSLALIRAQVALRRGALEQAASEWTAARAAMGNAEAQTAEHANLWRLGGEIALQRKDYATARAHLEQALAADRSNGLPERVRRDLRLLAEAAEAAADPIAARDYYRRLLQSAQAGGADTANDVLKNTASALQRLDATLAKENP